MIALRIKKISPHFQPGNLVNAIFISMLTIYMYIIVWLQFACGAFVIISFYANKTFRKIFFSPNFYKVVTIFLFS